MYTLIQAVSIRQLFEQQLPAMTLSLIIAEVFYKFHSFTLEAVAFLATWYVLDAIVTGGRNALSNSRRQK